jgi:hypothetical protein
MRWNFPLDEALAIQPSTQRSAGAVKRFRISHEVGLPTPNPESGSPRPGPRQPPETPLPLAPPLPRKRGLASTIGRKILKVFVYPVSDPVLGPVTAAFAGRWEERHRPHVLRRFASGDREPLTGSDFPRLAAGPALLLVHGTFSTSGAAFGGLPDATLEALGQRYDGRVFAFDHPTLHVDPYENVRWFLEHMPSDAALDLDVICHSRGGLVARCLAERRQAPDDVAKRCRVRRAVLIGVPNRGTALAAPDHMVELLDRMTSALNLFPESGVVEVLEAVLTVVKVIGHAGLVHLEGLAAMNPDGAFLRALNAPGADDCTYFAVCADFEPASAGLGMALADRVLDRVFEHAGNDLVVPTEGMYGPNGHPAFPVPPERRFSFSAERGVTHTTYFSQRETGERLLKWLAR